MPNRIKPLRSYTANAVPTTSDLETNELAINWADGKAYTKNAAGNIVTVTLGGGGGSGEDAVLRALFVPAAPTSVTATAGNAQATVSWTAPTGVLAQAPVSDYVVQFSSNSGSTWSTFSDGTSTATSATVTGLTNGQAVQFRVAATNVVGTGAYSTASSAVTPTAGDPYWANVQLLLPGDTSVNDASSYNRSVSAVGATVSTAQKRWGAGSIALDGSSWLTVPQASISLGSQNFVIECWFYMTASTSGYKTLWAQRPTSSLIGGALAVIDGSNLLYFISNSSASSWAVSGAYSGLTISPAQWSHIAMVRSGNTVTLYLNGTAGAPVSLSGAVGASGDFSIGAGAANGEQAVNGYIDDLRITVGFDRGYTGATIPVPTAASSSVTPSAASVPGAPTNLGFGSGSCGQGGFSWTAPASNGGSAITGYRLRGSADNYATFTAASSTYISGFRNSFAGLGANNTWTVRVSAVNSVGEGPYVAFTMLDDNNNGFAAGCG